MNIEKSNAHNNIERVSQLRDYLSAAAPMDEDPYEAACSHALSGLLHDPAVEHRFVDLLDKRSELKQDSLPLWAIDRMLMSATHMIEWSHITKNGGDRYQTEHTNSQTWTDDLLGYLRTGDEEDEDYYKFSSVMTWADLNTIKPNRRVASEFLLKTHFADRAEPIDTLDVGCSRNDLLVMMALNFERKNVLMRGPTSEPDYTGIFKRVIDSELPPLGQKIGVD